MSLLEDHPMPAVANTSNAHKRPGDLRHLKSGLGFPLRASKVQFHLSFIWDAHAVHTNEAFTFARTLRGAYHVTRRVLAGETVAVERPLALTVNRAVHVHTCAVCLADSRDAGHARWSRECEACHAHFYCGEACEVAVGVGNRPLRVGRPFLTRPRPGSLGPVL